MVYSYSWEAVLRPGRAVDFFTNNALRPFDVQSPGFSRSNGWWLSELSRLMYVTGGDELESGKQTSTRNHFLCKVGLKESWFYNGKHLQCAIIQTKAGHRGKRFSTLVFRGTQGGLSSWLFNLSTVLSPWPSGGRVHKGFKHLLMDAWQEIQPQLDHVPTPLYYTGHSLGGALAVLAASLKEPSAVYTFGSPRVGNLEFINATQHINIYRVVNPRDIVTNIHPLPGLLHVGEPHTPASPMSPDSERSWFEAPDFLADHSPANYTFQL
ncbi:MAG: lipase family protein [Desulforhopalus sp.]